METSMSKHIVYNKCTTRRVYVLVYHGMTNVGSVIKAKNEFHGIFQVLVSNDMRCKIYITLQVLLNVIWSCSCCI